MPWIPGIPHPSGVSPQKKIIFVSSDYRAFSPGLN
jgi:hypothetical protein